MDPRPVIPLPQALLGLTIFASIALPLTRDGLSLLDIFLRLLVDSPIGALTFLIMFASPQLLGLGIAIGGLLRDRGAAEALVMTPTIVLQGMTALTGMSLVSAPRTVAPLAYVGFAAVTSLRYLHAAANAQAGLGLRWHMRHGALLIVGLGLWLRLQSLGTGRLGLAIDVATAAAALLLTSLARDPAGPPRQR
jgi:hypothetical protein